MISKLEDGKTVITLGSGTVFIGNVSIDDNKPPAGICFSSKEVEASDDSVIVLLPNNKAVASYLMSIVSFLGAHGNDKAIDELKEMLEPMMPTRKEPEPEPKEDDDFEIIECSVCEEEKAVEKDTWALDKGMCEHCYALMGG